MPEMLTDGQQVRQHLGGMEFIGQPVPYRHLGILCQLLHDILTEAPIFYSVVHPRQNPCSIRNAFLFADLGAGRIQIGRPHSKILRRHLKGASGAGARLLKDQRHILAPQGVCRDPLLLFLFQLCCQIDQIHDFLRSKVQQLQKIPSF